MAWYSFVFLGVFFFSLSVQLILSVPADNQLSGGDACRRRLSLADVHKSLLQHSADYKFQANQSPLLLTYDDIPTLAEMVTNTKVKPPLFLRIQSPDQTKKDVIKPSRPKVVFHFHGVQPGGRTPNAGTLAAGLLNTDYFKKAMSEHQDIIWVSFSYGENTTKGIQSILFDDCESTRLPSLLQQRAAVYKQLAEMGYQEAEMIKLGHSQGGATALFDVELLSEMMKSGLIGPKKRAQAQELIHASRLIKWHYSRLILMCSPIKGVFSSESNEGTLRKVHRRVGKFTKGFYPTAIKELMYRSSMMKQLFRVLLRSAALNKWEKIGSIALSGDPYVSIEEATLPLPPGVAVTGFNRRGVFFLENSRGKHLPRRHRSHENDIFHRVYSKYAKKFIGVIVGMAKNIPGQHGIPMFSQDNGIAEMTEAYDILLKADTSAIPEDRRFDLSNVEWQSPKLQLGGKERPDDIVDSGVQIDGGARRRPSITLPWFDEELEDPLSPDWPTLEPNFFGGPDEPCFLEVFSDGDAEMMDFLASSSGDSSGDEKLVVLRSPSIPIRSGSRSPSRSPGASPSRSPGASPSKSPPRSPMSNRRYRVIETDFYNPTITPAVTSNQLDVPDTRGRTVSSKAPNSPRNR